ncbi:hypothetical protein HDV02_001773 [Globomyces sp. JEL0801]|nr:hypothetical protein HDV02_001773 [Globomyces sp. JEL0801]
MLDDHVLPSSHVQTQQEPPYATFTSLENLPAPIRPSQSQTQLHNVPRLGFDVLEDHTFPSIQVQTQQIPLSKSPHALFGVFQNQTFHLRQSRTRLTELPNEPRTGFVPLDGRAFSSIQSQQTLLSNSLNESHSKFGASTDIHHKNFYQSIPLSQSKSL